MKYRLRLLVIGVPDFIEISKDEFNEGRSTQEKLLAVFNIEATFDLLLENYAEFERDCLGVGLRLAIFGEHGEPLGTHREVNRRVANLLSSARLYLDQTPQELNSIYGKESIQAGTFKDYTRKQYDSSLAYRVLEALRNHSQHFGFPVHGATHSLAWEDTDTDARLRAGLELFINIQRLKENRKFNKKVVGELTAKADRHGNINLTALVRKYMEGLCEVHQSLRGLISADVASWDQTAMSMQDRARAIFGEKLPGLSVVAEEKDEEGDYVVVDSESIDVRLIEWRQGLEVKNRDFGKLSALYVSGRTY